MFEMDNARIKYCAVCLIRAQIRLTNILGEATIREMLNSQPKHRFAALATTTSDGRLLWATDVRKHIVSDGERCTRFVA